MNFGNEKPELIDIFERPINETMFYRYLLALHWCRDKDVLDTACGFGYGSHILRTFAKSVTGMDIDNEAINWAKIQYPHIKFITSDILESKLKKEFDVVVSIETFEHLPRHEINNYINKLKGWCKEGGTIFITSPQRLNIVWEKEKNNSHLYEYSVEEFTDIIMKNIKGTYYFYGLQEISIGLKHQLVSVISPYLRDGHIMVGVIENVHKS
jgi:2-polyprenyl-3-methyl-5-hydroxy-6-metoxy-1,4-benzoquinol methylase